jgi:hypothetical protein
MIVNKLMRNSKSLKIQDLALLLIGCDKTNIGELSSAVFFIILFARRESRGLPASGCDTLSPSLPRARGSRHSFSLGRLGSGASSTFDQLRYDNMFR